MTAEIAILNKEAVALAADSAVTLGKGVKIYNNANKLFMLSKFHPVGIMVYGNASFMNIPWETIIKTFRKGLHDKCYDTLEQYASKFIDYLEKNEIGISEEHQAFHIQNVASSIYLLISEEIDKEIQDYLKKKNEVDIKQTNKLVSEIVKKHYDFFNKQKNINNLPKNYLSSLKKKFNKVIIKEKDDIFEKLKIKKIDEEKLLKLPYLALTKEVYPDNESGVVITGFGEKEFFPSIVSYHIESVVLKKLKFREMGKDKLNEKRGGLIIPYAQIDMVQTFMEGIDKQLLTTIEKGVNSYLSKYTGLIIDNIGELKDLSKDKKEKIKNKLNKISSELSSTFIKDELQEKFIDKHSNSIMNAVSSLPKRDLASLAEALVNLTSLKRKYTTTQKETVGGAIDVAVISKGDGFIWIKRKHYFKPEYNPHFFSNYILKLKGGN